MPANPVIVITGATSGIGRMALRTLAKNAGTVVLVARDSAKADETRAEIKALGCSATIEFVSADFRRLGAVARAGASILTRFDRVDCLINNAGIHAFEQRVTEDGFAEMVAVNYLAPWLLTAILKERIVATPASRIITVASEASRRTKDVRPEEYLRDTSPFTKRGSSVVYGRTKLMNIMFSLELARQMSGKHVAVNCLDPGFNVTGLGRELSFAAPLARILNALRIGSPARGAELIVRLAADPAYSTVTGKYFTVRRSEPISPAPPGDAPEAQRALWIATAQLLRPYLPG